MNWKAPPIKKKDRRPKDTRGEVGREQDTGDREHVVDRGREGRNEIDVVAIQNSRFDRP